jgi:D-sedoheptulose 7-phosphate isomerase
MDLSNVEQEVLDELNARRPDLTACVPGLLELHEKLVTIYDNGGTFYVCGNGGSMADASHIVGELNKSFERKRTLDPDLQARLMELPFGDELANHLEAGLRSHTLGLNDALKTAVENDIPVPGIAFAQELNALARPGDILLCLSTSGNARNCRMAMSVAKALGVTSAVLTGPDGGAMKDEGDIIIYCPGSSTKQIQEAHISLWHTTCCLIEAHYFPEMRG